jgi:ABC-2 type transport system ATP-binding protein
MGGDECVPHAREQNLTTGPLIEVRSITKLYGKQKALDDVSFTVAEGQIAGFLGPNGAGKSTMMKILTGYIPPTSGEAFVTGHSVTENSMEVRRNIGYLPEHNPLYLDMYVKEFLAFMGSLHGVANVKSRVAEMIEITGLGPEQKKKIGALSKGYRQRVGLAQAMIHDPRVLIMDEPTTGLDPNQIEEIRNLIRSLGSKKTVMLSTHIMQEVEALCDKVIIIDRGRVVADDATANLRRGSVIQLITVEFDKKIDEQRLRALQGIDHVKHLFGNTWQVSTSSQTDIRKELFAFAVSCEMTVLTMNREEQKIEAVFRELTRKS